MSSTANGIELDNTLDGDTPRWFGEPVWVKEGPPEDLKKLIPSLDRRLFSLGGHALPRQSESRAFRATGENRLSDLIVRMPLEETEVQTPVAIVSKHYKLIQHTDLFASACEAIKTASIDLGKVSAQLTLSAYGSKMALTFTLPKKFDFDPGDGQVLNLSFHSVNSVDGRCRLRIMLGWFRFICGNGLVVGTAQLSRRFIHSEYLDLPDLTSILAEGLKSAETEKASFISWMRMPVEENRLEKWTDGPLREEWGPLAAARVHLICETGQDGRFAKPGEKAPPHRKSMIQTGCVPGAPKKAGNAYHIAQALAWIAKEKRDIQDQLDGMVAIPRLMAALLK